MKELIIAAQNRLELAAGPRNPADTHRKELKQIRKFTGLRAKKLGEDMVLNPGDKFQIGRITPGTIGGSLPYKIRILSPKPSKWLKHFTHNQYLWFVKNSKKVATPKQS